MYARYGATSPTRFACRLRAVSARKISGRIFSFGFYVFVFNAGARLSFETAALIIGALLTVSTIPYYVVANSMLDTYLEIARGHLQISSTDRALGRQLHA